MRASFLMLALVALAGCRQNAPVAAPAAPPRTVQDPSPKAYASEKQAFVVSEQVVGLDHPWSVAFLPDGGLLVTERAGRLRWIAADGSVSEPVEGLPKIFVDGQAGLLDVALSPGYPTDGLVYLAFAEPTLRGNKAGTAVVRGKLQGTALVDATVVYRQEPKLSHGTHVGARLVFDDQGALFVTHGDNRVGAATAQELDKLSGKIVRIHPDGTVPADNPFVAKAGARGEIWSYGHRNVQGAALHPVTRQLWATEHGPMGGDELNLPKAGLNYGWPVVTHGVDYSGRPVPGSQGNAAPGMEPPHHVWMKSPGLSGMAFYTGDALPGWKGNLFLGALASKALIRLELDGDRVVHQERLLVDRNQRIRDVRQGPDGALYVLVDAPAPDGKLLRIAPAPAPAAASEPAAPAAGAP
jgi:glucose/arabinose dehydrogenase